jgi:translocation and assembly module TamA
MFEGDQRVSAAFQDVANIAAQMVGDPARSQRIIDVEQKIMRRLPELGYPLAKLGKRHVIVDHADARVSVTYRVTPGPQLVFGKLTVTGLKTVHMSYLRELVPWREGARYDQTLVDSYRARLAATGLFSLIRVVPAGQVEKGSVLPMAVIVREAKHHTYGGGVSYSSGLGFGAQLFWENRNLFGNQEKLRTTAKYSQILKSLGADFVKPNFMRFDQKLLANVTLVRDTPVAYRESAVKSLVAIERQINKRWAVSAGGSLDYSHIIDVNGSRKYRLFGVPLMLRYDGSNSLLNPTKGMRFQILVQPYTGTESGLIHFIRNEALGSVYFPLDKRHNFVFAARTRVGGIFGESRDRLPADKRFYAGGGNSIRGYRYQFVGPVVAQLQSDGSIDQVPVGGRSVFEVGAEMRVKVTRTIGVVPFVEGGNVFDRSYPDFSQRLRWGAGLGIRYYTDFAPIRFDFAIPLNRRDVDSRYQIYISIGQAF